MVVVFFSSGGVVIVYERKVKLLYGKIWIRVFVITETIKVPYQCTAIWKSIPEFSFCFLFFLNIVLFSRRWRYPFSGTKFNFYFYSAMFNIRFLSSFFSPLLSTPIVSGWDQWSMESKECTRSHSAPERKISSQVSHALTL